MAGEMEMLRGIIITRLLCQNPKCRNSLGGVHFPSTGGFVFMECQKCRHTSLFINETFGLKAAETTTADFNRIIGRRT